LLEHVKDPEFNVKQFEESCGIGINVSDEEIEYAVMKAIEQYKPEIIEKR
jgi:hypothetical protein